MAQQDQEAQSSAAAPTGSGQSRPLWRLRGGGVSGPPAQARGLATGDVTIRVQSRGGKCRVDSRQVAESKQWRGKQSQALWPALRSRLGVEPNLSMADNARSSSLNETRSS